MFYVTPDLGIGKLISGDHCLAQVRLFHSIARQEVRGYPPAALKRIQLQQETRVYVDTGQGWRIGRVVDQYGQLDDGGYDYLVQFPNRQFQRCSERELEVRCLWPHPDPTEVLAKGGMETQFWHDRRQQLLDVLIRQRAASRGMSGLLSSRIELVRHQVEVVRRVLEDPLQRYLLADEVGLGKTIEAGCILRQTLLAETIQTSKSCRSSRSSRSTISG